MSAKNVGRYNELGRELMMLKDLDSVLSSKGTKTIRAESTSTLRTYWKEETSQSDFIVQTLLSATEHRIAEILKEQEAL